MGILWVFVFLLEVIKFLLIGKTFFELKSKRYWLVVATAFVYIGIVFRKPYNVNELTFIIVLLVIFDLVFILDVDVKKRIIGVIKVFFIVSCIDGMVGEVLKIVFQEDFRNNIQFYIISNGISISSVILISILKKKFVVKSEGVLKIVIYICAVIMGSSIFLTIPSLREEIENVEDTKYIKISNFMIIVYYISIMMIILFLLYVNNTNQKIKKFLETERLLKETQKNYYETMLEKEEITRRFRHDMINHLMCVREFMVQDQYDEALEYIENLQEGMRNIQQKLYHIGNPVIDAIMNYYIQLLDEKVYVTVSGSYIKEADISQIELCTIFSNLIKNAVEEINRQKEGKKFLKILFHNGNETIKIEIVNSTSHFIMCKDKKKKNNILPETSKKDHKNHGIGLRNVKETVEKEHGIFQWEYCENSFKAIVVLPCKRPDK